MKTKVLVFFVLLSFFNYAFLIASPILVERLFYGQGFSEISVDDFFEKSSSNSTGEGTQENSEKDLQESETETLEEKSDGAYSSSTQNYVVVGVGSTWYYETLNEFGRPSVKTWYEGSEKVKTQIFTYQAEKLTSMIETAGEKKVFYYYNENEFETKRVETLTSGETTLETIIETKYNAEFLPLEVKTFFQGFETVKVFSYDDAKKVSIEEYYENGVLVSKTEYQATKKLVSLYEKGILLKVFEEPL